MSDEYGELMWLYDAEKRVGLTVAKFRRFLELRARWPQMHAEVRS